MKNLFGWMAGVVMAVCLLTGSALADNGVTLSVEADRTEAQPGEEVTYTIAVDNASGSGVAGLGFDVYVPSCMEYVSSSVTCGTDDMFMIASYNEDSAYFAGTGTSDVAGIMDESWTVMTLTCRVRDDAGVGDCTLSLGNVLVYDGDLIDLAYSTAYEPVTINGDPEVEIVDEPAPTPEPTAQPQEQEELAQEQETLAEQSDDESRADGETQDEAEPVSTEESAEEGADGVQTVTQTAGQGTIDIRLVAVAVLVVAAAVILFILFRPKKGKHQ